MQEKLLKELKSKISSKHYKEIDELVNILSPAEYTIIHTTRISALQNYINSIENNFIERFYVMIGDFPSLTENFIVILITSDITETNPKLLIYETV